MELGGRGLLRISLTAVDEDVGVKVGDWLDESRPDGEAVPSLESFFLDPLVASLPLESYCGRMSADRGPVSEATKTGQLGEFLPSSDQSVSFYLCLVALLTVTTFGRRLWIDARESMWWGRDGHTRAGRCGGEKIQQVGVTDRVEEDEVADWSLDRLRVED